MCGSLRQGLFRDKERAAKSQYLSSKVLDAKLGPEQWGLHISEMARLIKKPWEDAFLAEENLKSWREIGLSPFNRCVFWMMKEKETRVNAALLKGGVQPDFSKKNLADVHATFDLNAGNTAQDDADLTELQQVEAGDKKLISTHLWRSGDVTALEPMNVIRGRKAAREEIKESAAASKLEKEKKAVKDVADRVRVGDVLLQEVKDSGLFPGRKLLCTQLDGLAQVLGIFGEVKSMLHPEKLARCIAECLTKRHIRRQAGKR